MWKGFKERILVIGGAGKAYWSLYTLLFLSVSAIGLNIIFHIFEYPAVLNIVAVVGLLILGELLYLQLVELKKAGDDGHPKEAGIIGCVEHLYCERFFQVMSRPGMKWVLNTWIVNLPAMIPSFKKALKDKRTEIEITLLSRESNHVRVRMEELGVKDYEQAILVNLDHISMFLRELEESQRSRVRVYEFDSAPKFIIYGSDDVLFVGHFWPRDHAVQGPQLVIQGSDGCFAKRIRKYYNTLERRDITEEVLEWCEGKDCVKEVNTGVDDPTVL